MLAPYRAYEARLFCWNTKADGLLLRKNSVALRPAPLWLELTSALRRPMVLKSDNGARERPAFVVQQLAPKEQPPRKLSGNKDRKAY